MGFEYDAPSLINECLSQGEILKGVTEFKPSSFPDSEENPVPVTRLLHPVTAVMTAACDLYQDFTVRSGKGTGDHRLISHVLLCDLREEDEVLHTECMTPPLRKLAKTNQAVRYHRIPEGSVKGSDLVLPQYFIDFKMIFSLPRPVAVRIDLRWKSCPYSNRPIGPQVLIDAPVFRLLVANWPA